jgi:hypothetical protein
MSEWRKAFERLSPPGEEPASARGRARDKADFTDKTHTERQANPSSVSTVSFVTTTPSRAEKAADAPADPPTPESDNNHSASATPPPKPPRRFRPGALPGDPPTPIVDPEATRVLCILELAGAAPRLTPDGTLELARPELVTPETRAAVREHQDDLIATLTYRYLLEATFPVSDGRPARNRS